MQRQIKAVYVQLACATALVPKNKKKQSKHKRDQRTQENVLSEHTNV